VRSVVEISTFRPVSAVASNRTSAVPPRISRSVRFCTDSGVKGFTGTSIAPRLRVVRVGAVTIRPTRMRVVTSLSMSTSLRCWDLGRFAFTPLVPFLTILTIHDNNSSTCWATVTTTSIRGWLLLLLLLLVRWRARPQGFSAVPLNNLKERGWVEVLKG